MTYQSNTYSVSDTVSRATNVGTGITERENKMTNEERHKRTHIIHLNGELLEVRLQCIKLMEEFLDLSNVKVTNLEHLEAIRQELNTLMGQFVEAWSDKNNPHIS